MIVFCVLLLSFHMLSEFYSSEKINYCSFQVFLHTSKELPQVRDLGFAIPPGTHALVGVRLNEVLTNDLWYFFMFLYGYGA